MADLDGVLRWNALAPMALVAKAGGEVELAKAELEALAEDQKSGARQFVLREEGDKLVVFIDEDEKHW